MGSSSNKLIRIHCLKGYVTSIYLAEYKDKLLLLDGASRADVRFICQFITLTLGRAMSDLKLIVVTHMHPDHSGGAYYIKQLSGCKLAFANNNQQHWYSGLRGMFRYSSDVLLANWLAMHKGKPRCNLWAKRELEFDFFVDDNAALPFFPDWQVVHTPGHTNSDISLYHHATKSIYVADLIIKARGSYFPPIPVTYPKLYQTSLAKVLKLDAKHIYLAHSGEATLTKADINNLNDALVARRTPLLAIIKLLYKS